MVIIYSENRCFLINHDRPTNFYQDIGGNLEKYQLKNVLFDNFKRKQKVKSKSINIPDDLKSLNDKIQVFLVACKSRNTFPSTDEHDIDNLKTLNVELMNKFYESSTEFGFFHGENNLNEGRVMMLNDSSFLIPPRCRFFNKKIEDIKTFLPESEANKFDFIVIDPPWTNRYIKRVKKNSSNKQGYSMMSDEEIVKIPLENYIGKSSIVVIWSTNSDSHINAIKDKFLENWKLKLLSSWQWVKVDKNGELFCAIDGNKKPFEQIFIATHIENFHYDKELEQNFTMFSQPSSIHSHKPPLIGEKCDRSYGIFIFLYFQLQKFSENIYRMIRNVWKFSREI